MNSEEPEIVDTNSHENHGQTKCPKCGATDIQLNSKTGKLRCNFCRFEFEAEKEEGFEDDVWKLDKEIIGSGAKDIEADKAEESRLLTIKCSSCGAEVVIDTAEATNARCHWCRNVLSVKQQVPNGAVPDAVLPFAVSKADAKSLIGRFVGSRRFFANKAFLRDFSEDNVIGVYFPYVIVDVNAHATLSGQGERQRRVYVVKKVTHYDADLYEVQRDFDIAVKALTIESSAQRLNKKAKDETNNIINSIMPFDTENCVKWDANFLRGFNSEKRDVNVATLRPRVEVQCKDIARYVALSTIGQYNRGVSWKSEKLSISGEQWRTAYLPVWLYSYKQTSGMDKGLLHYVAVNARTKETMGSVPINRARLFWVSALVEVLSWFSAWRLSLTDMFRGENMSWAPWLLLSAGFVYYWIIYRRYRNNNARHYHEKETKYETRAMNKIDRFVRTIMGTTRASISGRNQSAVNG